MTERLGLPYGHVELAASDPAWPEEAERLAESIRGALGTDALAVEHIGSTAVPGLLAKPILDLAVLRRRGAESSSALRRSATNFAVTPATRAASSSSSATGRSIGSRTFTSCRMVIPSGVGTSPSVTACAPTPPREPRTQLKLELAARFPRDRPAYTAGKDAFIASL